MPDAANEVVIERPRDEVYAFLANPENDLLWRGGVLELKHAGGERYTQKVKGPGGRAISADIEIVEREPNRSLAFRTVTGPVRPEGGYTLSAEGTATRVRFELHARVGGLKRLMAPMVQRTMDAEVAELSSLKRVLESGADAS